MDTVICKELIVTTLTRRGKGTENNPIRVITQVFEKDGTFVAEHDPFDEKFAATDLVHFVRWCDESGYLPHKIEISDVNKWSEERKLQTPQHSLQW